MTPTTWARTRRWPRWLTRTLAGAGALFFALVVLALSSALLSRRAFAEIKPHALELADEFARCSLAQDRACVLRLSSWDASTCDKGMPFVAAVERKLGKRGAAKLEEGSVRYVRFAATGAKALRWRIQFCLDADYENDAHAKEVFVLEDRGQGLKVVGLNFRSDRLLPE